MSFDVCQIIGVFVLIMITPFFPCRSKCLTESFLGKITLTEATSSKLKKHLSNEANEKYLSLKIISGSSSSVRVLGHLNLIRKDVSILLVVGTVRSCPTANIVERINKTNMDVLRSVIKVAANGQGLACCGGI